MTGAVERQRLVGARIVVQSERVARPRRAGLIEQIVHAPVRSFRVLWDDGRTTIVTPESGCARIEPVRDGGEMLFPFRSINDSIRRVASQSLEVYDFVCECRNAGCTKAMRLSIREYDEVRAVGNRFAIAPGHERPSTERVVTGCERYLVVERRSS